MSEYSAGRSNYTSGDRVLTHSVPLSVLQGWVINVSFWPPLARANGVASRARHESHEPRQEVERLQEELGDAVAKGVGRRQLDFPARHFQLSPAKGRLSLCTT